MSALQTAFEALCDLVIRHQDVYPTYSVGAMPENDSIVLQISAGGEENVSLDLHGDLNLDVVVNAKHRLQREAFDALADIHHFVPRLKELPNGDGWQLLSISTSSAPTFIERDSDQFLYGSGLEVHLYLE